mgnify:CR=1 FL=1
MFLAPSATTAIALLSARFYPVFRDVAAKMKRWRLSGIKLYVLSNGWTLATKNFLAKTTQGNLALLIENYFDTEMGSFAVPETFRKVIASIHVPPQETVLITKSMDLARAAKVSDIAQVVIVQRNAEPSEMIEDSKFPRVRTFNDIEFELEE